MKQLVLLSPFLFFLWIDGLDFKFGFIGGLKIKIVGADVLDGPMPTREDSLSGKGYLRGVEDVAPYIWLT